MKKFFNHPKKIEDYLPSIEEKEKMLLYNKLNQLEAKPPPLIPTEAEREIIKKIQSVTKQYNLNNITRTNAYFDFYQRHPEIHWAFLAHMVSRNGGYSMTDLKSSIIRHFLTYDQKYKLFHFLERANALIFHDAYPQLLLYEISKKQNKSYFHLLSAFQISQFMLPNWSHFLTTQNSTLLTLALVTNEQHYIEKNLMSLEKMKKDVFHSLTYIFQEKMGFSHVIFPYKRYPFLRKYVLAGVEIHDFSSVVERIDIGKQLYAILYSKHRHKPILDFAQTIPHSGSRSDYWPHIYTSRQNDDKKIKSPKLEDIWENVNHQFPETSDWFKGLAQIEGFERAIAQCKGDITKHVKQDLNILKTLKQLNPFHKKKRSN